MVEYVYDDLGVIEMLMVVLSAADYCKIEVPRILVAWKLSLRWRFSFISSPWTHPRTPYIVVTQYLKGNCTRKSAIIMIH